MKSLLISAAIEECKYSTILQTGQEPVFVVVVLYN